MDIEYRNIPGYPGYHAGSDGSIWSRRNPAKWRQMKPYANDSGHLTVRLQLGNSKEDVRFVHHLILLAFVGPPKLGQETRHFPDPNPGNNRLENLCWGTRKENVADMISQGRMPLGEKRSQAKLTRTKARQIYLLHILGCPDKWMVEQYGVTRGTLQAAYQGRTFKPVSRTSDHA
jgi:hypothetical protein